MKKVVKGIMTLGLALSVLCSSVCADAYSNVGIEEIGLRCDTKRTVDSELIIMATTGVDINGKIASLNANITCELDTTSIDAELILQIYAESAWPTVTSWRYTENESMLIMDRKFTLNSSGKYRAKCVITAHRGSKTEKIDIYSGERNYTHKS